ncbi:MAG: hypothetical protein EON89_00865 [Brevundimonas sp.]|nr:MAG: hypothetical protein EON89_00865 [Brevundimonas sp.]
MDEWPQTLVPIRENWTLQGVTISGGNPKAGPPQVTRTDGGGFWVGEQHFVLTEVSEVKLARAVEAILDGGLTPMVAWSHEDPFAPEGIAPGLTTHSDGTPFSDGALYTGGGTGAVTALAAPLRATTLTVDVVAGALEGGERFSIVHPNKGRRRYSVKRVFGNEVIIRPPLREAVEAGAELDFLRVGCVAKLSNPEVFGDLDPSGVVEMTVRWIEVP